MVVNNSGIELAIALIVAPRTPSVMLRPKYSEEASKPSLAFQIIRQQNTIKISGISSPKLITR